MHIKYCGYERNVEIAIKGLIGSSDMVIYVLKHNPASFLDFVERGCQWLSFL